MSWIQLYSGKAFYFQQPNMDDVTIEDVAHSLSMQCRYAGHTLDFYSVAEHCCLMHDAIWRDTGSRDLALTALLHDAAEVIGDTVAPLKSVVPEVKTVEHKLDEAFAAKFGLVWLPGWPPEVKSADQRICRDEAWQAMGPCNRKWDNITDEPPLGVALQFWAPGVAKNQFLKRYQGTR